ncbi:MAG: prepilin-type N-terminal cleavage/methylation domain-containing protein [Flexistipes sinusarabici]|uniref:Prepilin-type N-terminal cleavage/methylation domain-containing protein n=1 Tax=Flexistipes sinusarabici TaxID=2352 RepID=A0A5D0MPK0_FLESI|nr:MAG: prepilin-type N-terminal cleavage/methylation domain-containing protein [Flexistipes sinusarabici]
MFNNKGFTLIEIIIFIVVFSIGVMGIMMLFFNTLGKTSDPLVRLQGIQTAQAVMESISLKKFDEDTPEGGGAVALYNISIGSNSGETFSDYDDIDDFVDSCGAKNSYDPQQFDLDGNYEISIKVEYAKIDASNTIISTCNDSVPENKKYKLITVNLINKSIDETYTLKKLKGNF